MVARRCPESWIERLEACLPICSNAATQDEEAECLSFIARQLRVAPEAASMFFGDLISDRELAFLLKHRAIETAVASLLRNAPYGFMLSRAAAGPIVCTVVLPGSEEETIFEGASEPMVRLGAVLKAFLSMAKREPLHFVPPRERQH